MFRRFCIYSFLIVLGWFLLVMLKSFLNPSEKGGPDFTAIILVMITQIVVAFFTIVTVIVRVGWFRNWRLLFGYNLVAVFNLSLGLLGVWWMIVDGIEVVDVIIFFVVDLLTGIIMLIDSGIPAKINAAKTQNTIS